VDFKELRRKLMILYGMNLNKRNKIPEIALLSSKFLGHLFFKITFTQWIMNSKRQECLLSIVSIEEVL
jgi:hypothetical protein